MIMNRRIFFRWVMVLLLLPLVPAGLNAWLNPRTPSLNPMQLAEGEVSLDQALNWDGPHLLVDARAPEAFADGHIPNAINLYMGQFDSQVMDLLDLWTPGHAVIVYCDSRQCGASSEMAERLRGEFGMEDVFVLKGGWEAWRSAFSNPAEAHARQLKNMCHFGATQKLTIRVIPPYFFTTLPPSLSELWRTRTLEDPTGEG